MPVLLVDRHAPHCTHTRDSPGTLPDVAALLTVFDAVTTCPSTPLCVQTASRTPLPVLVLARSDSRFDLQSDSAMHCVDMGAVDFVSQSPLRVKALVLQVYRMFRQNHNHQTEYQQPDIASLSSWHFDAFLLNDSDQLIAGIAMISHILAQPGLDAFHLSSDELAAFFTATRETYRSSNPYHNFRHAIDVLQATFVLLVASNSIPPLTTNTTTNTPPLPITHCLALAIAAVGHDVGHPGVNNAFLVNTNAPLAQMYSNESVLEHLHCAALAALLQKHWPATQQDPLMCSLISDAILATDMSKHFDYVQKLKKLKHQPDSRLLAAAIIKAADISNSARPLEISLKWSLALKTEFDAQSSLETTLGLSPNLPPDPSQHSFITVFANPLFTALVTLLPQLAFTTENIAKNLPAWSSQKKFSERRLLHKLLFWKRKK